MVFKSFYYKIIPNYKKLDKMDFDIEENVFYDEVMNKLHTIEEALYLAKDGTRDKEVINEIFRAFHTVKGVSDLLGFVDIVKLTHKAEDLLDEIRNDTIKFSPEVYSILMNLKEFVSKLVTDALRGRDMNSEKKEIFDSFIKDISSHLSKSVLILEKQLQNSKVLEKLAKEHKFDLITQSDINTDAQLHPNNIKLVFWDIEDLKDADIQRLDNLRENSRYTKVYIILCVEKVDENLKSLGKRTGAAAWIKKPYEKEKLHTLVEKLIG
jgi:chemotaxis protein histidine kinase CheA